MLAADGMANDSIAHQVGASPTTVRAWPPVHQARLPVDHCPDKRETNRPSLR